MPWGSLGPNRIGAPALALIAIQLPSLLISAAVVWELALLVDSRFALELLLGWLLSGLLVFARSVEERVAERYMRLRRPNTYERHLLVSAWERVCHKAGVRPETFTLWVEESVEANAFASGGHIVAITRRALTRMDPAQTEAVLAHELGHHLKGHAWVGLLFFWYALPGRLACRLFLFVLSRSVAFAARVPSLVSRSPLLPIGIIEAAVLFLLVALWLAVSLLVLASPVLLTVAILPYLQAAAGRQAEFQADLVALRLGYGPGLLKFFYQLRDTNSEVPLQRRDRRSRMLATHPSVERRIERLEVRLLEPWSRRGHEYLPPQT